MVRLRADDRCRDFAEEAWLLPSRVAQIVPHHLLVREIRVHEVSRVEALVDAQESPLVKKPARLAGHLHHLHPLLGQGRQRRLAGQHTMRLEAVRLLEEAEVLNVVYLELLDKFFSDVAQCGGLRNHDFSGAVVDQKHLYRYELSQGLGLFLSDGKVHVGDALPRNHRHILEPILPLLINGHGEKGARELLEDWGRVDGLRQHQEQVPSGSRGARRGVLRELLHHLHVDLVGDVRLGFRGVNDILGEAFALHVGNGPVQHPAQNVAERLECPRLQAYGDRRERLLDLVRRMGQHHLGAPRSTSKAS
mmetsp:Transcript_226/g.503  ORF Transcript_226/g.503 Transcript_226/m.503 type:complete len:306 (-) Transcript_226:1348-2265(-)